MQLHSLLCRTLTQWLSFTAVCWPLVGAAVVSATSQGSRAVRAKSSSASSRLRRLAGWALLLGLGCGNVSLAWCLYFLPRPVAVRSVVMLSVLFAATLAVTGLCVRLIWARGRVAASIRHSRAQRLLGRGVVDRPPAAREDFLPRMYVPAPCFSYLHSPPPPLPPLREWLAPYMCGCVGGRAVS